MSTKIYFRYFFLVSLVLTISCNKNEKLINIPNDSFQWDKYAYPSEENIRHQFNLLKQAKFFSNLRSSTNPFEFKLSEEGPGNIGGRITALAVHPINTNIIYAGFSIGGLFKTIDGGNTWNPIFDNEITNSIGTIAIDPVNPEIVYVGTGDPDINGNSYIGNGIFKSTNGGTSWTNIGLQEVRVINEIIINPLNPEVIYAGAMGNPFEPSIHRGVYKSTDGGMNWTKVLFIANGTGISDMDIDPMNPNILYAASFQRIRTLTQSVAQGPLSKIYKSIDGGNNWNIVMNGITSTEFSRIAIALSPSNPSIIYARCVKNDRICSSNSSAYNMEGLYKSTDKALNWTKVQTNSTLECDYLGGFGWYFGHIAVHPKNPDHIFLLGVYSYFSKDAGINWEYINNNSPEVDVHVDHHILIFDKFNNMILGTDGGVYKFTESTQQWRDIENIATTQFYRIAYSPHNPDIYFGGAQDNGTSSGNKNSVNSWTRVFGGDGFQAAFHSQHPEYIWVEYQNGNLFKYDPSVGDYVRFKRGITGTANWDAPYFLSVHNEDNMYFGTNKVFMNTSPHVDNWIEHSPDLITAGPFPNLGTPNITCMAESPLVEGKLIAGTSNGNVWIRNFKTGIWSNVNANLPSGYVTSVKASESDSNTFFVSFSNFRNNDFNSYLYITRNNGLEWNSISSNLLQGQSINDILIFPEMEDKVIFIATLTGVYGTIDSGTEWYRVGNNMPYIPINSIIYNPKKKEIAAGSFSRSLWTFDASKITSLINNTKNQIISIQNPVQDLLHIKNNETFIDKAIIVDQQGRIILSKPVKHSHSFEIELSGIQSNFYFLKLQLKNSTQVIKFVKI